jgi:hypothetical protein
LCGALQASFPSSAWLFHHADAHNLHRSCGAACCALRQKPLDFGHMQRPVASQLLAECTTLLVCLASHPYLMMDLLSVYPSCTAQAVAAACPTSMTNAVCRPVAKQASAELRARNSAGGAAVSNSTSTVLSRACADNSRLPRLVVWHTPRCHLHALQRRDDCGCNVGLRFVSHLKMLLGDLELPCARGCQSKANLV